MTIKEIQAHLQDGTMTAREVVDGYLERIHKGDAAIGAFIEVFEADARHRADEIDAKREANEELGALAGVPVAIKDNMLLKGKSATGASRILEDYKASYTSTAVQRLLDADAIVIGRANMDEFACGSSTETSAHGITKNPLDKERVPGGSSGGSAAAVAAGFVPVALGSDTGGSIRQPASLCGVVGYKPTYGHVSRYGLMAMASSLDQIGPLATTVEDAACVYRVIAGSDEKDMTSTNVEAAIPELGSMDMKGKRIGVPKQFFDDSLDTGVLDSVKEAIEKFESAGAVIVWDLDIPMLESALAMYYVLMPAEVSSNMNRYDGMQYGTVVEGEDIRSQIDKTRSQGFGPEVKRRILLGSFVLSAGHVDAYYKRAVAAREALRSELDQAFMNVDVIMGPTSPSVAWKLGEKFDDPMTMYLSDIYTVVANLAGIPAISVPCGMVDGLPVGLQIMSRADDDASMLGFANWFEHNRGKE